MTGWTIRPEAEVDLNSIWDYSFEVWGIGQAHDYLRQFRSVFEDLAAGTRSGQNLPGKHKRLCRYRMMSHLIIYEKAKDHIDVVRILHIRMDIGRHLD